MRDFTQYMLDFYGVDSQVYPEHAFSVAEIVLATQLYQMRLATRNEQFEGDTIDRERVRDIILDSREYANRMVTV